MLRIRPEQMRALASAGRGSTSGRIARGLQSLGFFDPANVEHVALIGATDDIDAGLRRFVNAKRAEGRAYGIEHPYLGLHFVSFFFRFGGSWQQVTGVEELLSGGADAAEKLEAVRRLLHESARR